MSLKDWVGLSMSGLNFIFVVWVFVQNRRAATRTEMTARNAVVDAALASTDKRLALLEQGICAVPGDGDIADVYSRINEVNDGLGSRIEATHGEVRHVCGLVSGLREQLADLNRFLLEHSK